MPNRISEVNKKFIYTKTNPENIISGKKGSWFFRTGKDFYLNVSGDTNDRWEKLPYGTVILPRPNPNTVIQYEHEYELWVKTTDGFLDEFKKLMPKTGWKFHSYENVFFNPFSRNFRWCFPVPASSYDTTGNEGCRSYDENFFYYKTGSIWYRTPISIFTTPTSDAGEQPSLYSNLPFVVAPRHLPVPTSSNVPDNVKAGDQTYDDEYFYIRTSKWKRSPLISYDDSKMTLF